MFGNKEKALQAEEIKALKEENALLKQRLDQVNKELANGRQDLEDMSLSEKNLDADLNKIVDYAKSSQEFGAGAQSDLSDLQKKWETIDSEAACLKNFAEENKKGYEEIDEKLLQLMDASKTYTGVSKKLQTAVDGYLTDTRDIILEVKKMQAFSGNMSALALNSAIEAGRMGDVGRKYVKTADEIRIYTENFTESIEKLLEKTSALTEDFSQTGEDIRSLISMLKDNNKLLTKITTDNEHFIEELNREQLPDISKNSVELTERLDEISSAMGSVMMNQRKILEGMEAIGVTYIANQISRKSLEVAVLSAKAAVLGELADKENNQ